MGRKDSQRKRKGSSKGKGRKIIPTPKPELVEEEKGQSARKWYLLLAVVMVVSLASYLNSFHNKFVFDDLLLIREHPGIKGVEKIPGLLNPIKRGASYRPIRTISYAVDYTLNKKVWKYVGGYNGDDEGLNPLGYHISNCVYHFITAFLVFLIVYRLAADYRIAFLAASLFILHPVHTDSVTYLSGRRDILSTLFYLAGFYLFLCYRKEKKPMFVIASFLAYLLALGSKEMAVTLPAVFLCYDFTKEFGVKDERINLGYFKELFICLKRVILQSKYLYSLTFLGAFSYGYYKVFVKSPSHQLSYYGDSMLTTFLTVGKILVHYMKLLIYPINLNADYSYNAFPLSTSLFDPATLFSFILLVVIGYVILRLLMFHKMAAFGVIWFFVTLLPVCHIFPHHELLAEHYLYLPSFGFCLTVAYVVNGFLKGRRYVLIAYVSFVVVVLLFSLRIVDRNRDWRDEITLWGNTVRMVPLCARARANLCAAYVGEGRIDEALTECETALAIKPNHPMAHNNLGTIYSQNGKLDEAIYEYKQAVAIKPRYAKAHYNLGVVYFKKGKVDEAITQYKRALAIRRNRYAAAHNNLGIAYARKGMFNRAIFAYKRVISYKPRYAEAYFNYGVAFAKTGELDKAIILYKDALRCKPDYADAHNNLGIAYASKGMSDDAIEEYKRALAIKPRSAEAHYNLGVAYFKKGELDKAITEYKHALAIKADYTKAHISLGSAYYKKGRLDEAIAEYKQALAVKPGFAGAHNNLAMAYCKKKKYSLAIKHCDKAVELGWKANSKLLNDLLPYR